VNKPSGVPGGFARILEDGRETQDRRVVRYQAIPEADEPEAGFGRREESEEEDHEEDVELLIARLRAAGR